jgi:hypothetical protein
VPGNAAENPQRDQKRRRREAAPKSATDRCWEAVMSAAKIRELNDAFRTTMTGGQVMMTAGVDALASDVKAMVIRRVATFSDFNADNDPHQEHDFGSFTLAGRKFFFKIDAYDAEMQFGSEDPTDPVKTTRVLTIMLAEEY